jgi:hypothetical protein
MELGMINRTFVTINILREQKTLLEQISISPYEGGTPIPEKGCPRGAEPLFF